MLPNCSYANVYSTSQPAVRAPLRFSCSPSSFGTRPEFMGSGLKEEQTEAPMFFPGTLKLKLWGCLLEGVRIPGRPLVERAGKELCCAGKKFSSAQSLSRVWLFATPWTAARQASLSITNSRSLLKLMSIESVMPSSHLILCRPLLLLLSIFPSIRVFSNESVLLHQVAKVLELQHQSFQWILRTDLL